MSKIPFFHLIVLGTIASYGCQGETSSTDSSVKAADSTSGNARIVIIQDGMTIEVGTLASNPDFSVLDPQRKYEFVGGSLQQVSKPIVTERTGPNCLPIEDCRRIENEKKEEVIKQDPNCFDESGNC